METTDDSSKVNGSAVEPEEESTKKTSRRKCQQTGRLKCLRCSADVLELPENSSVTQTADCFFRSVAEGLNRLKVNEEFNAKRLREVCHRFAVENDWVKTAVINDARLKSRISDDNDEYVWNVYLSGIRCTADDIEKMKRNDIPINQDIQRTGDALAVPIWGRPEIEGRMICERYSVKLHVVEKGNVDADETQVDEILEKLHSVSVNDVDDRNTIHIVRKDGLHFEPVLSTSKFRRGTRQRLFDFPNCDDDDSDSSQSQVTLNESLINIVRGSFPEEEKVKRLKEFLTSGADVNFKDANLKNNTPLHFAVKKGEIVVVAFLVGKGADVTIKNDKNETPLNIAHRLERYEILPLLELQRCLIAGIKIEEKQDQKTTFNKAVGSAHTQLYNIRLAILFLLKGLSDQIDSFCLASKMEDADNFGDIVLKYKYTNSNNSKIVFLAGKDETDHILTMKELLQDSESEFELQKYFASYLLIKKQFSELDKSHPIFGSKFNDCDFIIYTSASINFGTQEAKKSFQEVSGNEAIFDFLGDEALRTGNCYKMIYDEIKNEVKDTLRYSADCYRLARELAESCFEGVLDITKPIIKTYHLPLMEKVLEMLEPGKGKFRRSFLNNDGSLSAQEREFRSIFLQAAEREFKLSEEKLKSAFYRKSVKIPSEFWVAFDAKRSKEMLSLPCSVSVDDIKDFFNKLKIFVRQPNRRKLSSVVRCSMQEVYNIDNEDVDTVFAEVEMRVRDWCLKENYYLTKSNKVFQDSVRRSVRFDIRAAVTLFTGRTKELLELHRALHNHDKTTMSQMVCITGLEGVGKSELARKYISEFSKEYDDNIIWINAATCRTAEECFRRLSREKLGIDIQLISGHETSIKSAVSEIYDYFGKKKRKSLFVFDSAKTLKGGIDTFLPSGSKIKPFVLITSHSQEWINIKSLNLDAFTDAEAAEFIEKALTLEGKIEKREVRDLTQLLQNFPLALRQAVAYVEMENTRIKSWSENGNVFRITDYLRLYKEKGEELLKSTQAELGRSQNPKVHYDKLAETAFRTSTITLDEIQQHQYGEEAVKLLNVSAYLAPSEIPGKKFFSNLVSDEVFHNAVELLDKYSMITLHHGKLNVHSMVQHVTRMRIEEKNTMPNVASLTLKLLKQFFPLVCSESEDYSTVEQLVPHLEIFLEHLDNWMEKNPLLQRTIELNYIVVVLKWIGGAYLETSSPKTGKEFLERALSVLNKHYGPKHSEVAEMLLKLSIVYGELGNPQKQKQLAERALPILEEHYGHTHTEVAMALESLGMAYGHLGFYKKEEDLLVRALAIWVNHLGYFHPNVGATLLNLGSAFGNLGDYQKQIELTRLAVPIMEKFYGPDHVEVAIALEILGCAEGDLGDPQKQKDLLERSLPVLEKRFGRQSRTVSVVLKNLSRSYADLGDYQTSKKLLEEALTITEREYGPKHFNTAAVLESLGLIYGALGNPQKHKDLLEKALLVFREHYGPDSPRVALTLVNLSKAYAALGVPQKEKKLLEDAFPVLKKHYGNNHYMVAQVLLLFGDAHEKLGDSQKAKDQLEQALSILRKHFGPEHYEVAIAISDLGTVYGTLGYPDKQIKLSEQALPILKKHFGHSSLAVATLFVNLSKAYGELGNSEKQKELLEEAIPVLERYNGHSHYDVARVQALLSRVHGHLGDNQKKKAILEQCLPALEKHFGSEHYEVAAVLCDLGIACGAVGYPHEHEKYTKRALHILEKHYGPEHFRVAEALESLGTAYGNSGDFERQKDLHERALSIFERHYGRNHYKVAEMLLSLGETYRSLCNPRKQMELVIRALPILKGHYGPDHGKVGIALGILGTSYGALGDFYEQKDYLERSLSILENQYGCDHYNIAVALECLGSAYFHLGNYEKHKELLERALAITERHCGPNHFSVGIQLRSLSSAYGALGDPVKQKDLLERALPILERYVGRKHWKLATILIDLGRAYGALGNNEKTKQVLERALLISEGHFGKDHIQVGKILMNLSSVHGALGNYRKQKELSERASLILAKKCRNEFDQMFEVLFLHSFFSMMAADVRHNTTEINLNDGLGPLHCAAKNGDLRAIVFLIARGLDVNACDYVGLRSPLHFASENGDLEIVDIFLHNRADIEAGDINNSKPLHYAAENNHQVVIKFLLERGANVDAVDSNGKKALDYTTTERIKSILRATSALFNAAEERNLEEVKNLVHMGGVVNAVDVGNLSVMHYAAHNCSPEAIEFLVNEGAKVNIQDKDGWTPLHYAAQRGQRDIVVALLHRGADVDSRNKNGETPLSLARKHGNSNVRDLLSSKKKL